jgi:hypothetical protein
MSIILVMENKIQLEVEGYLEEATRWAKDVLQKKPITVRLTSGAHRETVIPGGVSFFQVIDVPEEKSIAEEREKAAREAAEKAAAEVKASPHPGRGPVKVIPGGKR